MRAFSIFRKVSGWILIAWTPLERVLQWAEHFEFASENLPKLLAMMASPTWFLYVAPSVGIALIAWDIWDRRRTKLVPIAFTGTSAPRAVFGTSELSMPVFISLSEAATRLYESTAKVGGVRLSVAAERLGNTNGGASPNERLDYLATFLSQKIPIYGRKPPARDVNKIDGAELKRATFTDGAMTLRDNFYDKSIYWEDLCVRSDELNTLLTSWAGEEWVPIHTAIAHVASLIGDKNDNERDPCFPATRREIRQAAADGKLRMRGRRQLESRDQYTSHFDDVHEDIPAGYWKTAVLGPIVIDPGFSETGQTMPKSPWDWHPTDYTKAKKQYAGITVNRSDLLRLWPLEQTGPL